MVEITGIPNVIVHGAQKSFCDREKSVVRISPIHVDVRDFANSKFVIVHVSNLQNSLFWPDKGVTNN